MAKDRIVLPGLPRADARVLIDRISALEDRLAAAERKPGRAGIVTSDYSAKAGEFVNVEARSGTLVTITLPESTPALRGARITLAFRNSNQVRIVAVQGTVNGEGFVLNDRPGTYDATADGLGGWFVQVGVSEEGSGAGGGGGSGGAGSVGSRLVARHWLTSGTSLTLGPDTTRVFAIGLGGGGGGGGADAASSQGDAGGGAGAGGLFEKWFQVTPGDSLTYAIGAAGTGVLADIGTNGGDTTLTYAPSSVSCVAGGGLGGGRIGSNTTTRTTGAATGGTASGGDVNCPGAPAVIGLRADGSNAQGGTGGSSRFGGGGVGARHMTGAGGTSADGPDATGFGAGGAGAINFNNSPSAGNTGGDGTPGLLYIEEWAE